MIDRLLTTAEVGELLRVSPDTIREMVAEGLIVARRIRPRGQLLIPEGAVQEALQAARVPQPAHVVTHGLPVVA
jgi:excisionase family DNA binding protein